MDRVLLVAFLAVCLIALAATHPTDPCALKTEPSDRTKYRQTDNGQVLVRSCAPGTEFSEASCACVRPENNHECQDGFHLNNMGKCVDVDECVDQQGCCGQLSCRNTVGSFVCYCEDGLEKDSYGGCKDIDECKGGSPCSGNKYCENSYGSFECISCPSGHKVNGNNECIDIDECAEKETPCGYQSCRNTVGSFECYCEFGYILNKQGKCVKKEEKCSFLAHQVDKSKFKQKVFGQIVIRSCAPGTEFSLAECGCVIHVAVDRQDECEYGFELNKMGKCVDVNECAASPDCCGEQSCRNTVGSFECYCEDGLQQDSYGSCKDIDECEDHSACSAKELCINNHGSFECLSCKPGFRLGVDGSCDEECDRHSHPTDKTKYKQTVNGVKIIRSCPAGTVFSKADCWCVHGY